MPKLSQQEIAPVAVLIAQALLEPAETDAKDPAGDGTTPPGLSSPQQLRVPSVLTPQASFPVELAETASEVKAPDGGAAWAPGGSPQQARVPSVPSAQV
ncbi:MAG: hypothetical protein IPG96_16330 [Proteobacteria bacterium]|nr:hypothetical protein [Pseudomonadota bacterium]